MPRSIGCCASVRSAGPVVRLSAQEALRLALAGAVAALDAVDGAAIIEAVEHPLGRRRLRELGADLRRRDELRDRLRHAIAGLPAR